MSDNRKPIQQNVRQPRQVNEQPAKPIRMTPKQLEQYGIRVGDTGQAYEWGEQ